MNGSSSETYEPEELVIASDANDLIPPSAGSGDEAKLLHSSAPSPKRSRLTVEKRVVTVPIGEAKGAGEGAPPADAWAWRKYGQKPIKGSPYPRGYYRCSSSRGCPARKQVERSRLDPAMIVVTYSFDHNHSWPIPKNHHKQKAAAAAQAVEEQQPERPPPAPQEQQQNNQSGSPPESAEREEKFSELISEDESALMVQSHWFPDVCPTASTSTSAAGSTELLYGSVFFAGAEAAAAAAALPEEEEAAGSGGGGGLGGEEESLFAGLGELPECSMVLRRGLASASWVGTTG